MTLPSNPHPSTGCERTNLSQDYIKYVVRHGLRSMPPFAPSDLTDARLEVLAALLAKK